jgi:Clp amino terminal domain, pathogenicity island component
VNSEPLEVRLYRRMLRFFPEKFQRDYADEMLLTFRDNLKDATREGRLPTFWMESVVDLISSLRLERCPQPKREMTVMNRYTDESRLLFHQARMEQWKLKHGEFINPEHLLLGIVTQDCKAAKVLNEFGCTLERLRERINELRTDTTLEIDLETMPQVSVETRQTMKVAQKFAGTQANIPVEPHHILKAILEQTDSIAYQAIQSLADPAAIRTRI